MKSEVLSSTQVSVSYSVSVFGLIIKSYWLTQSVPQCIVKRSIRLTSLSKHDIPSCIVLKEKSPEEFNGPIDRLTPLCRFWWVRWASTLPVCLFVCLIYTLQKLQCNKGAYILLILYFCNYKTVSLFIHNMHIIALFSCNSNNCHFYSLCFPYFIYSYYVF